MRALKVVGVVFTFLLLPPLVSAGIFGTDVEWQISGPPLAALLLQNCYDTQGDENFNGSLSSDPLGQSLTYNFTYSDNITVNQTNPAHTRTFSLRGDYWLNLTVWDPDELSNSTNTTFEIVASCVGPGGAELPVELPILPVEICIGKTICINAMWLYISPAFITIGVMLFFIIHKRRRRGKQRPRQPPTPAQRIESKLDFLIRKRRR